MERRFNLIKSDFEKHEKRILPRFPFCYLTFKADDTSRVYEVKDISHTGMQLSIKDDQHTFAEEGSVKGSIHWLGKNLDIAGTVKWVTSNRMGVEFWLRSDGPVELFIWQHGDGEIAKIQILFMETFVEWEDGAGLKTGRTLSKRNVDSPLINEDEWIFKLDSGIDEEKLARVKDLVNLISDELLPSEMKTFLLRQLS
jgi:hypothetical protein